MMKMMMMYVPFCQSSADESSDAADWIH